MLLGMIWMLNRRLACDPGRAAAACALRTRPRKGPSLGRDEAGTATIEFVLVTPILLFVMLSLVQTVLLVRAQLFVHYAAFAAARAAVVHVPRDLVDSDEPANFIRPEPDSAKRQAIHAAAAMALAPVAGADATRSPGSGRLSRALRSYYLAHNRVPPRWVERSDARLADAAAHTTVSIRHVVGGRSMTEPIHPTGHLFDEAAPIVVRVRHRFRLAVPYVRPIFADGREQRGADPRPYALLVAEGSLLNEGDATRLPEAPPLPRVP